MTVTHTNGTRRAHVHVDLDVVQRLLGHFLDHHEVITPGEFAEDLLSRLTIRFEEGNNGGERTAA
ncbi:MAG: hypothetical protein Q7S89_02585 [bacterium]|nr:hypothetical protein [bacterium]